jgi:TATA-binding protein-associated factor Taf7
MTPLAEKARPHKPGKRQCVTHQEDSKLVLADMDSESLDDGVALSEQLCDDKESDKRSEVSKEDSEEEEEKEDEEDDENEDDEEDEKEDEEDQNKGTVISMEMQMMMMRMMMGKGDTSILHHYFVS